MPARIALGGIEAEVVFKDIRNVHLTVLPPNGRVRISAPTHMALDTVRVFALSKLAWIKSQRKSMLPAAAPDCVCSSAPSGVAGCCLPDARFPGR